MIGCSRVISIATAFAVVDTVEELAVLQAGEEDIDKHYHRSFERHDGGRWTREGERDLKEIDKV